MVFGIYVSRKHMFMVDKMYQCIKVYKDSRSISELYLRSTSKDTKTASQLSFKHLYCKIWTSFNILFFLSFWLYLAVIFRTKLKMTGKVFKQAFKFSANT